MIVLFFFSLPLNKIFTYDTIHMFVIITVVFFYTMLCHVTTTAPHVHFPFSHTYKVACFPSPPNLCPLPFNTYSCPTFHVTHLLHLKLMPIGTAIISMIFYFEAQTVNGASCRCCRGSDFRIPLDKYGIKPIGIVNSGNERSIRYWSFRRGGPCEVRGATVEETLERENSLGAKTHVLQYETLTDRVNQFPIKCVK